MDELLFVIVFIGMTILFIMGGLALPTIIQPDPPRLVVKSKSKKKIVKDPMKVEAKKQIVSFGFPAEQADKVLQGLNASSVQEYIQEAMKRIKI